MKSYQIQKISVFDGEKYYAVIYDTWYIGRILEILDQQTLKIIFLKSELDEYWPKQDDIIQVLEKINFLDQ